MDESDIPSKAAQAQEAFGKDLPSLLGPYRGQWAAYLGRQRVAIEKTQVAAYQRCLDQGLKEDDFVVFCIEPGGAATTLVCPYPLSGDVARS
jgi:hypothetical protein